MSLSRSAHATAVRTSLAAALAVAFFTFIPAPVSGQFEPCDFCDEEQEWHVCVLNCCAAGVHCVQLDPDYCSYSGLCFGFASTDITADGTLVADLDETTLRTLPGIAWVGGQTGLDVLLSPCGAVIERAYDDADKAAIAKRISVLDF